MNILYSEKKENLIVGGATIAKLRTKIPVLPEYPKIEKCYAVAAEKFIFFIKNVRFKSIEEQYAAYCDSGGRRSKFDTEEFSLYAAVAEKNEKFVCIILDNMIFQGAFLKKLHRESVIWNAKSETVLSEKDLKKELKIKIPSDFEGFYFKNNKSYFFKNIPIPENGEYKVKDLGKFIHEHPTK